VSGGDHHDGLSVYLEKDDGAAGEGGLDVRGLGFEGAVGPGVGIGEGEVVVLLGDLGGVKSEFTKEVSATGSIDVRDEVGFGDAGVSVGFESSVLLDLKDTALLYHEAGVEMLVVLGDGDRGARGLDVNARVLRAGVKSENTALFDDERAGNDEGSSGGDLEPFILNNDSSAELQIIVIQNHVIDTVVVVVRLVPLLEMYVVHGNIGRTIGRDPPTVITNQVKLIDDHLVKVGSVATFSGSLAAVEAFGESAFGATVGRIAVAVVAIFSIGNDTMPNSGRIVRSATAAR